MIVKLRSNHANIKKSIHRATQVTLYIDWPKYQLQNIYSTKYAYKQLKNFNFVLSYNAKTVESFL
jgi:hypothetical protein